MARLQLEDHGVIDHEIGAESADLVALEPNGDWRLASNGEVALGERDAQRGFVDGFDVPIAELVIHA